MNSTIAGRLKQAGLVLPAFAPPKYQYLSATRVGSLLFLSGKTPQRDGQVVHPGRLGAELGPELGREAARIAALNLLAAIEHEVGLEHVRSLAKVTTFVASADGFTQQPLVADAASEAAAVVPREGLGQLPRERRANHLVDVARGYSQWGKREQALTTLLGAEQLAPAEVRCRPMARATITDLVHRSRGATPALLRDLADRAGVPA